MSLLSKQLRNLEKKSLSLEKKVSFESPSQKQKLYLKIQKSNHYLYNILKSRKDEKFEILSMDSTYENLKNIPPNIMNKIFTLNNPNIGNIVKYQLFPESNTLIFDINEEEKIFDKLPDVIIQKEEKNSTENEKNVGYTTDLIYEYNKKYHNCCNQDLVKGISEFKYDEDEEDTKSETQEKKIRIDEKKISKISFSETVIKFSSSKEINDTLIVNYEELKNSPNLDYIIELLTNNDYYKDSPSPIFFENDWYIPLPEWAYSIKSLDFFNLTLTIIILLIIQIISQNININWTSISLDVKDDLDDIFEQNKKKIAQLKEDEKIPQTIFSKPFLSHISQKIKEFYYQNNNLTEEDKYPIKQLVKNQLNDLQQYISEYKTSQEQLEKLFEKITFYSSSDILNSYHYTFVCFRKFLLNCSSYIYLTKILNDLLTKISNENKFLKPYKDLIVSQIKTILSSELKRYYNIDYTDYGSSAMGLDIESSDRDILIYFEIKNKLYFLSPQHFYQKVKELINEKLPYLTVNTIYPKSIDQLIRLEYKQNQKEIKIDITFTKDKKYAEYLKKMIELVKSDLEKNPNLGPLTRIVKSILYHKGLNIVYKGGLNSLSVFFLCKHIVIIYKKTNPSLGLLLYLFLEKYSKYDFTYGIDENGREFPYDQSNLKDYEKRFIIKNPIIIKNKYDFNHMNGNIASGCFEPKKIIDLFKELLK